MKNFSILIKYEERKPKNQGLNLDVLSQSNKLDAKILWFELLIEVVFFCLNLNQVIIANYLSKSIHKVYLYNLYFAQLFLDLIICLNYI